MPFALIHRAVVRCGKQKRMIRWAMLPYPKGIAKEAVCDEKPKTDETGKAWEVRK
jgi:hypothetical protein